MPGSLPPGRTSPLRGFLATDPAFAHPSEEQFSRILSFYRVRWEYEPHTFVLERDEQGEAVSSFTPDFWLPDLGTYVELTTMRQRLVTRKNRKLRRFRERYPRERVRVLYRRDIASLAAKYRDRV